MYRKGKSDQYKCVCAFVVLFLVGPSLSSQDWQRVGADYNATDIAHDGRIVVVGDFGGIMLSEDDGMTWSLPRSGTWAHLREIRFRFRDAFTGFAAGDGGTLLRTTDGGHEWVPVVNPVRSSIYALDFPVGMFGYGLADSGLMIRTTDGGDTWDTLKNRLPGTGTGMQFINEERGVVVTAEGVIYHTATSGLAWEPVFTDSSLTFSGVAFNAPRIIGYACTRERVVVKTTDAGKTWERVKVLEPGLVPLCIGVSEAGDVYVGGHRITSENPDSFNAVAWSDDGGMSWKRPSLLITGYEDLALEELAVRDERLVFAGNNGTVLIARAGMDRVEQRSVSNSLLSGRPGGAGLPAYRVAFSGDTGIATVKIAAPSKTVFLRTTDGGLTWQYATSSWLQNYLDIFGFPGGEFLVFSSLGDVQRTTDLGRTWITQSTELIEPRLSKSQTGIFVDRQRGYMAGDSLVYQTTDGGRAWHPKFFSGINGKWSGLTSVQSLSFPTFETGYVVLVTGESSRVVVLRTTDAGETWQEVLSRDAWPAYYGLHFIDKDRGFYCEGKPWENTGWMFSTTDGGGTWDSVRFDDAAPSSVKFFDDMNGFVLGSPFFLLRTTDGGGTWIREYPWPSEVDSSGATFTDIALLSDERTVVLIGNGVLARKTYPDKLLGIEVKRRSERPAGILTVVPNPASDRVRIKWHPFGSCNAIGVRLFDGQGRDVSQRVVPMGLSSVVELDVSALPAGTYQVVVEGEGRIVLAVQTVVIVR